ncbi:MAG: hypothetical protein JXR91_05515 [Deltaproteobacteria bacterium]|nr:hypothetical protein [Deltaproteobacteria bacterium]
MDNNSIEEIKISGQLSLFPSKWFVRVLLSITGLSLVSATGRLILRYLFNFRQSVNITAGQKVFSLKVKRTLFNLTVKNSEIVLPEESLRSLSIENSFKYLHLVAGAGFLVAGIFTGVHFILDGLGARYPYLALMGAFIIALGVILDALLYFLVPQSSGFTSVNISTQSKNYRISGVEYEKALQLVSTFKKIISEKAQKNLTDCSNENPS